MAKVLNYTDATGTTHTESYWRIVQINIGVGDGNGVVTYYGYRDQAARAANKQSIGSKSYSVSGTAFATMMAAHLAPGGPNIMAQMYAYATATNDIPDPTDPTNATKNTSFFAGAQDA